MTDFQAGRVAGVFNVGSKIERLQTEYETQASSFESMKVAFAMVKRAIDEYVEKIDADMKEARIAVKEASIAKDYVKSCGAIAVNLFQDAEAKRLAAVGATDAVKAVVQSVKRVWDEEKIKLEQHEQYEATGDNDLVKRPIGADPGDPIAEIKEKGTQPRVSKRKKASAPV